MKITKPREYRSRATAEAAAAKATRQDGEARYVAGHTTTTGNVAWRIYRA